MSRPKKNRTTVQQEAPPRVEDLIEETERPRRRWLRWGLFALVGLLLLVFLAPTILSKTSARDYLLAKFIPADAGKLTIESMNVGWFSPLSMKGIQFADPDGNPMLVADEITGDKSLMALASNSSEIGSIVITKPVVNLLLRPDGSNLEDAIAKLVPATDEVTPEEPASSAAGISANIKLVDAQIVATELPSQTTWKLQQVNVQANLAEAAEEDWLVTAQGQLDGRPFAIDFATPMGLATEAWPLGPTGKATVKADALPLAPLRYAATRAGQPIEQLQGSVSSDLVAAWEPDTQSASQNAIPKLIANGIVQTNNLALASHSMLGPDVLRINSVRVDTKIQMANNVITIDQGDLNSDYGRASLVTTVKLDRFMDPNAIVEAIRSQQLATQGEIDIAALTRSLPHLLKIRDDVQIQSGRVSWTVNSAVQPGVATKWTGKLRTADVKVLRGGLPIDWQFPLEVDFSAVDAGDIQVENFTARSDFFALVAEGKLQQGKLQAQADLEALIFQLGQVMDLSNLYMKGKIQSYVQWSELQPNQLKLDGRTRLLDFQMTQNEQLLSQEAELNSSTVATATLNGQQIASIDSARFDVYSGQDFLVAELREPVPNPGPDSNWRLACRLGGELASWFNRAKTVGVGLDWQVAGQVDATTEVTANQKQAVIHSLQAEMKNLQAVTEGIAVNEPVVRIQTAGSIDLTTFASRFPETTVASNTVSLAANGFAVEMDPHFVVAGNVGYRADLGRLMAIMPSESGQQLKGEAAGRLALEAKGETTTFNLDGTVNNLSVFDATGAPLWDEPELTTQIVGTYDGGQDALELSTAQVVGKVLNLAAGGRASGLTSTMNIDLSGEYGYDLTGLLAIFRDMVGPDVELVGNQRQRFLVRGPVFPTQPSTALVANELVAQAGLGWDSGNVYGIPLGQAQVNAVLQNGVLQTSPLEIAVNEGRVRVEPSVHVNTEQMWMTLPLGVVAENVRLDSEMTGGWMKYIMPLLADATSAEGTFSVTLNKTEVPLMDPMAGHVEGEFVIHGGAVGPGPMATQLLDLATQIKRLVGKGESRIADPTKSWVQLQQQQIAFQMAENRVFHEGFQMVVDDVPIRTRGSVGIVDQSLAVMAEVPILDEWIASSPHLAGLKGQVISIPIGGTTSKPVLDRQALTQATMQLAKQGATGYLQGQVSKQIDKQLGGKLNEALGDELGGALRGFLGGGQPTTPGGASAPGTQQTPGVAPQQSQPVGNQLQDEVGKQLNRLFK